MALVGSFGSHPEYPLPVPGKEIVASDAIVPQSMRRKIVALFEDDPIAKKVVMGMMEGARGEELRFAPTSRGQVLRPLRVRMKASVSAGWARGAFNPGRAI
jgi:hypothetical protein